MAHYSDATLYTALSVFSLMPKKEANTQRVITEMRDYGRSTVNGVLLMAEKLGFLKPVAPTNKNRMVFNDAKFRALTFKGIRWMKQYEDSLKQKEGA